MQNIFLVQFSKYMYHQQKKVLSPIGPPYLEIGVNKQNLVFKREPPSLLVGASSEISTNGCKMPYKQLGISIDEYKSTFNPYFQGKPMDATEGATRTVLKVMGAIAPIKPL